MVFGWQVEASVPGRCAMFEQLKENYRRADQLKALDLLHDPSRYPALRELNSGDFRLQLYVVPSFEPYVSWSLFMEKEGDYTVRRVRWDCSADYYWRWEIPRFMGRIRCIALRILSLGWTSWRSCLFRLSIPKTPLASMGRPLDCVAPPSLSPLRFRGGASRPLVGRICQSGINRLSPTSNADLQPILTGSA